MNRGMNRKTTNLFDVVIDGPQRPYSPSASEDAYLMSTKLFSTSQHF